MRNRLLTVLAFVAVAWATARAATEHLRIMTYNVPLRNILVTDGNGRNTWENRCATIHSYMADVAPDILGMQEPVHSQLGQVLAGMPHYAMVGTGRDDGAEGGEFTPILYRTDRLRVLESGTYWLTDTPDEHSRVEGSSHYRIATWALMETLSGGARLLYTNTHLSYDSEPVRLAQIKILKQHMQDLNARYGEDLPHFLTGDFNMRDTEENYTYVLNWKLLLRDLWNSTRNRRHYSSGQNTPTGRIDYIYATRNVSVQRAQWDSRKTDDGFWMSDHDPLWADASFTTSVTDDARAAVRRARAEADSVMNYTPSRIRLLHSAAQLTSDGMEPGYAMQSLLDLNTRTFIHSLYSTPPPANPHYLQADLRTDDVQNLCFTYTRRNDNTTWAVEDRWKDLMVTASDDGEHWTYICHLHDFGGSEARSFRSPNIALRRPYRHVRFHVLCTPGEHLRNGHPQFSASEFQIYRNEVASDCLYTQSGPVRQATDALLALAREVEDAAEDGTVTRDALSALDDAVTTLREARSAATSVDLVHGGQPAAVGVYDLNGVRHHSPRKGIYVVNGTKVLLGK